jgi:integrase
MEEGIETGNPAFWAVALLARIEAKYPNTGSRNLAVSCARKLIEAGYIAGVEGLTRDYVERAQYVLRLRKMHNLPAGRVIPEDEIRGALRAASVRDRAVLAIGLGAGLRRAEIASLRVDSLRDGVLRVNGKGNRMRDVPVTPPVVEAVHKWLAVRPTHRGDRLFLLNEVSIYNVFRAYDLRPHDLCDFPAIGGCGRTTGG